MAIVTWVNAGYFDEPDDQVGISHVLEHMYFKGTRRRGVGEIARETKRHGGYLNAHTIYDHTAYYTVLPSAALETGLDIQSDAYANSVVDSGELARELEVIIQEAHRKLDSPSSVALESLYELMHDKHRIRRWRIGSEEGLRALTSENVLEFHRRWYQPANTVLSVVGDADTDVMLKLVEQYYGSLPNTPQLRDRGPAEITPLPFRYREWEGDISQAEVVFGWRTPGVKHHDTPALDAASLILGSGRASRLYRAVRDRKLATSIIAGNSTPDDIGVFNIHAETAAADVSAATSAIWAEVLLLLEDGVHEHELERTRQVLQSQLLRRWESMDGQATWLASWETVGGWESGEQYMDAIMSLTPNIVNSAVHRHLGASSPAIAIYRPRGSGIVASGAAAMRQLLDSVAAAAPAIAVEHSMASPAIRNPQRPRLELVSGPVHVYRTAGGVPVLVRRQRGSPLMHAAFHRLGGVSEEAPGEAGITLLMARAAVKGTARRDARQIAEELEVRGSFIRPAAGVEGFGWTVSSPLPGMDDTLDIFADVVTAAMFAEHSVDTERSAILGEIAQSRDDMYSQPIRLALHAAYGVHHYGRPVEGNEQSVAGLTDSLVRRWHHQLLSTGSSVLCIVADEDEGTLAARIASLFPDLRSGKPPAVLPAPWPVNTVTMAEQRERAQTALAVLFPSVARSSPDRFAAAMLATIGSGLGGRFFDELRERQSLAYTVQTFSSERQGGGVFGGYIATSPDKEEAALNGMLREFSKLTEAQVSSEELDQARAYTLGARSIRLQSGASVLAEMLEAHLYGEGVVELAEVEENIRKVSAEDILKFARSQLTPDRHVLGVVRGQ